MHLLLLFWVVLPQAVRITIPPLTNRMIGITKGTALGSVVALHEILNQASSGASEAGNPTPLTLGLRARHRQIVGQPDSPHVTAAIASEISTGNLWTPCRAGLSGEDEEAPRYLSSGCRYSRRSAVLESQCHSKTGVDAFVRFFYGQLVHEDAPELVFFQPEDFRDARIRLDIKDLSRVERIASTSNDLLLPLVIPFPGNTMVLSRGVKLRFFFDAGRAINEDTNYRAAGTGLLLPFGGDLAGVGSFALTRMSFLAVLYSAAGEEESRKPRLLFDISGDL